MLTTCERRWLGACAALAAGEGALSLLPCGAAAWPALALLAVWVALIGFGFRVRGWRYLFFLLLGGALFAHASVAEANVLREAPWLRASRRVERPIARATTPVRRALSRRLGLGLDHDHAAAALNRAILLGERASLPKATRQIFRLTGTVHVFAISGLHVMVVAEVLMVLIAVLSVPRRLQGALAIVPVWGYVAVVGAPPSAVRAALMASLSLLAPLFCRRANGLLAWAQAFLLVHVVRPGQIADVGSQLSYVVVLTILLAGRVGSLNVWGRRVLVGVSAWAAGLPVAAAVFGRIAPGALLANVVLLSSAAVGVASGTLAVLTSYVCESFAVHANNLFALMSEAMSGVADVVARLPGASFETPHWSPLMCLEWYAALMLVFLLIHLISRRRNLI